MDWPFSPPGEKESSGSDATHRTSASGAEDEVRVDDFATLSDLLAHIRLLP